MVEAVSKSSEGKQFNKKPPRGVTQLSSRPPQQRRQVCTRCGNGPHSRQVCPKKEATCLKCNKKGHYKAIIVQCATKRPFQIFQKSLILRPIQL